MPRMTMIEAIRDAMDVMMARDDNVVVFGEDVGYFGGVFRVHRRACRRSTARRRCFDTPISEARHRRRRDRHGGLWLAALRRNPVRRLHVSGLRPDRVGGGAAALSLQRASSPAPLVVRMPYGGGIFGGQTHSQSPEALFTHVAASRRWCRRTRYDAKGLLIAAIEDDDPVIFLEPKRLYNGPFDGHHDRPVDAVVEASSLARCRTAITPCRWARPPSGAKAPR